MRVSLHAQVHSGSRLLRRGGASPSSGLANRRSRSRQVPEPAPAGTALAPEARCQLRCRRRASPATPASLQVGGPRPGWAGARGRRGRGAQKRCAPVGGARGAAEKSDLNTATCRCGYDGSIMTRFGINTLYPPLEQASCIPR